MLQIMLTLYSLEYTWEYKALKTINLDMRMIGRSGMWPFTSYSVEPHQKSIPGDMSDLSPEELRYLRYTSSEDVYVEHEKLLKEDYRGMRCSLMFDDWNWTPNTDDQLCEKAGEVMMFLVKGVYISENVKGNASSFDQGYCSTVLLCGCLVVRSRACDEVLNSGPKGQIDPEKS